MRFFLVTLLVSLLASSASAAICFDLNAADTNAFSNWYGGLTPGRRDAVRTKLSIPSIAQFPLSNEICSSSPNLSCDDGFPNGCSITALDLEDISTTTANKLNAFPTQFYGLTRLNSLALNGNRIPSIPSTVSQLVSLSYFSAASNLITGTFPTEFALIPSLRTLILSSNQLTGTVPVQFATHPLLETFEASSNKLSGTIPTQWSTLVTLRNFRADTQTPSSGTFGGTIPTQWSSISALTTFGVSGNSITGTIPNSWVQATFSLFDVSNNQITGTLPTGFGNSPSLRDFIVANNQISGTLPTEYASFIKNMLEVSGAFVANNNQLQGTIPYFFQADADATPEPLQFDRLLLNDNLFCPKLDYSTWAFDQDYTPGCDMCALSLNNTAPLSLCDPGFTCKPDVATETYTCFSDPKVVYYVWSHTSNSATSSSKSAMKIRFVGSLGSTIDCNLTDGSAASDVNYAPGAIYNATVYCDISVGTVWSIYVTYENPGDFWLVDDIYVTHNSADSHYKSRVAVRNNDLLEAEFSITVQTNSGLESGTPAKVYAVLRDGRNYQHNLNFQQSVADGETITRTLAGYNLDTITSVFLGHYSSDNWYVDYVEIDKRGVRTRFTWNKGISRKTRPLRQSAGPIPA